MTNHVRQELENISHRFKTPATIEFPNIINLNPNYSILNVDSSDIFIVNPCLCIWVDIGYQQLNSFTTAPRHLKFITSRVYKTPISEFEGISDKYSNVLMISNLTKNRNYMTEEELQLELTYLLSLTTTFKTLFVGDPQ